jgi:hypothetical protein
LRRFDGWGRNGHLLFVENRSDDPRDNPGDKGDGDKQEGVFFFHDLILAEKFFLS